MKPSKLGSTLSTRSVLFFRNASAQQQLKPKKKTWSRRKQFIPVSLSSWTTKFRVTKSLNAFTTSLRTCLMIDILVGKRLAKKTFRSLPLNKLKKMSAKSSIRLITKEVEVAAVTKAAKTNRPTTEEDAVVVEQALRTTSKRTLTCKSKTPT